MDLAWMAWTPPTAVFFAAIGASLAIMTCWEFVRPTRLRRGWLPFATTRGDRYFLGLLSSAFAHLTWLALTPAPIWIATVLCALWLVALLRWG